MIINCFREAREEISVDEELTVLRNEASFLRKENFELKEKQRELEETIRDLRRNMAMMQGFLTVSFKLENDKS